MVDSHASIALQFDSNKPQVSLSNSLVMWYMYGDPSVNPALSPLNTWMPSTDILNLELRLLLDGVTRMVSRMGLSLTARVVDATVRDEERGGFTPMLPVTTADDVYEMDVDRGSPSMKISSSWALSEQQS